MTEDPPKILTDNLLRDLKRRGITDAKIGEMFGLDARYIRHLRDILGITIYGTDRQAPPRKAAERISRGWSDRDEGPRQIMTNEQIHAFMTQMGVRYENGPDTDRGGVAPVLPRHSSGTSSPHSW